MRKNCAELFMGPILECWSHPPNFLDSDWTFISADAVSVWFWQEMIQHCRESLVSLEDYQENPITKQSLIKTARELRVQEAA